MGAPAPEHLVVMWIGLRRTLSQSPYPRQPAHGAVEGDLGTGGSHSPACVPQRAEIFKQKGGDLGWVSSSITTRSPGARQVDPHHSVSKRVAPHARGSLVGRRLEGGNRSP